jgi:hypothetical protein
LLVRRSRLLIAAGLKDEYQQRADEPETSLSWKQPHLK